jgi:hypothetical protein
MDIVHQYSAVCPEIIFNVSQGRSGYQTLASSRRLRQHCGFVRFPAVPTPCHGVPMNTFSDTSPSIPPFLVHVPSFLVNIVVLDVYHQKLRPSPVGYSFRASPAPCPDHILVIPPLHPSNASIAVSGHAASVWQPLMLELGFLPSLSPREPLHGLEFTSFPSRGSEGSPA